MAAGRRAADARAVIPFRRFGQSVLLCRFLEIVGGFLILHRMAFFAVVEGGVCVVEMAVGLMVLGMRLEKGYNSNEHN